MAIEQFTDLWVTASEDQETADHERRMTVARMAAADVAAALVRSTDRAAYGHRKALYSDRLDNICQRIANNDPTGTAILRADLEASLDHDFEITHTAESGLWNAPGPKEVQQVGDSWYVVNTDLTIQFGPYPDKDAAEQAIDATRSAARTAGPYGRSRGYADDPYWLDSTKYAGRCLTCGTTIPTGSRAFYWPLRAKAKSNPLECDKCGETSDARFQGEAWDEDMMSRGLASKQAGEHSDGSGAWRAEVTGVGENKWTSNSMSYDTEEEAKAWLDNLKMRWMGYDMGRVVPNDTPKNEPVDHGETHYQNFRASLHEAAKSPYDPMYDKVESCPRGACNFHSRDHKEMEEHVRTSGHDKPYQKYRVTDMGENHPLSPRYKVEQNWAKPDEEDSWGHHKFTNDESEARGYGKQSSLHHAWNDDPESQRRRDEDTYSSDPAHPYGGEYPSGEKIDKDKSRTGLLHDDACCDHCAGFEAGIDAYRRGYSNHLARLATASAEFRQGFEAAWDAVSHTGSFRKGAPFADYKDFADCVSKNRDKNNPDAYCGKIKHETEDKHEAAVSADEPCTNCNGRGWVWMYDLPPNMDMPRCPVCNGTGRKTSAKQAVSGTPCSHCGQPVYADDPAYDPDWGLIQFHERCYEPYRVAEEARQQRSWEDMWDRANDYMREGWTEQGLSRERRQAAKSDSIFCSRCNGTGMVRAGGAIQNCTKCKGTGIEPSTRKMINRDLGEDFLGDQPKKGASESMPLRCNECDKRFKKKIGPNTVEARCPRCGGYDTEPDYEHPEGHKWGKTATLTATCRNCGLPIAKYESWGSGSDWFHRVGPGESPTAHRCSDGRGMAEPAGAPQQMPQQPPGQFTWINNPLAASTASTTASPSWLSWSMKTAGGKPPWLDNDNDSAKGQSSDDQPDPNANAEPNEDDQPNQDLADTQSHLDPSQMQAGQPVTITYTLTGEASGSGTADAQFESFDGTTAYFTYEGGRFAATQGANGMWQDAAGTTFDFALSGDPTQPPMDPNQPPQQTQPQQPPQDQSQGGDIGKQPQQQFPPKKQSVLDAVWSAAAPDEREAFLVHLAQNPYETGSDASNQFDTANNPYTDDNPYGSPNPTPTSQPKPPPPPNPTPGGAQRGPGGGRPMTTKPRQMPGGNRPMTAPAPPATQQQAPLQQGFR